MIFLNSKLWLPVWTGSKGQIGVTFLSNIFWQLTICTMVQKLWIYLLRLLRYDFLKIFNFDFRFGQEVKVKLGSLFYQYFLTINDLYNGTINGSIVQKLWIYLLWLLRKIEFFVNIFLTINDLYNGKKIVKCTSCGCWDIVKV